MRVTAGQGQVPRSWPALGNPLSFLNLDFTRIPCHQKRGLPMQQPTTHTTLQSPGLVGGNGDVLSSWGGHSCQLSCVVQMPVRNLGT